MFEELDALFKSNTIKPTFEKVHAILALLIFKENPEGIGRYRLRKELLIGSGTTRSLVTKLNEILSFITVPNENNRKGHILTEQGNHFLNKFKKKIPLLSKGDNQLLKELTINHGNIETYYCFVKSSSEEIQSGIKQRDAAIKVDGIGATCLIYKGNGLIFPTTSNESIEVDNRVLNYFKKEISASESSLEENDVIIIGLGDSEGKARLAALNAALTLI